VSTLFNRALNAAAPLAGAAIVLFWLTIQTAHADGECRFGSRRTVTLKTMGPCEFDFDRMSFAGDAAEQAACLTTKVMKFGQLGPRAELPEGFAKRVGQSLDLPNREAVHALLDDFGLDQTFGPNLSEPVASAPAVATVPLSTAGMSVRWMIETVTGGESLKRRIGYVTQSRLVTLLLLNTSCS